MTLKDTPIRPADRLSPDAIAAFRTAILQWYRAARRPLPWRQNRDPYRVWISEIMLQQTTVKSVLPYYDRFIRTFPTVESLAGAPLDSVLAAWSGLGYYSRARNLQSAAKDIVNGFGGSFPDGVEDARSLPGIGAYTAAAVLSIAYDVPLAVLDGNVARVVSRLLTVEGPIRSGAVKSRLAAGAGELLDPGAPGDFNQAMMELGATICTPRSPRCGACPVASWCLALRDGRVAELPEAAPPSLTAREMVAVALLENRGRYLLQRRPEDVGLMPGLWELPNLDMGAVPEKPETAGPRFQEWLRTSVHGSACITEYLGECRHAIMSRRLRLLVFRGRLSGTARPPGERRWVAPPDLAGLGTSSIVRKSLGLALTAEERSRKSTGSGGN